MRPILPVVSLPGHQARERIRHPHSDGLTSIDDKFVYMAFTQSVKIWLFTDQQRLDNRVRQAPLARIRRLGKKFRSCLVKLTNDTALFFKILGQSILNCTEAKSRVKVLWFVIFRRFLQNARKRFARGGTSYSYCTLLIKYSSTFESNILSKKSSEIFTYLIFKRGIVLKSKNLQKENRFI